MSAEQPADLIARHEAFLSCGAADRPLVGGWVGGYYPAEQFPRGVSGWARSATLQPEDVSFEAFAKDYEALYQAHRECEDDFFYVGSAYWGIPWLEAILGCDVSVAEANCRAERVLGSAEECHPHRPAGCCDGTPPGDAASTAELLRHAIPRASSDPASVQASAVSLRSVLVRHQSPWMEALLKFTRELVEFAAGRFPVCPPLLRGAGDAACALLGGEEFVTRLLDEPDEMKTLLTYCGEVRLEVLRRLLEIIPPWHGTHAAGGYPSKVWCRRTVAYYQDDCAALLNPALFREFILPTARQACRAAEVNFIHLHSACLYPVDILLEESEFDVLEINIDHEGAGPAVPDLIGTFQKIQRAGRPLLLWGRCSPDDWDLICRELSPVGLSLQPMLSSPRAEWRSK